MSPRYARTGSWGGSERSCRCHRPLPVLPQAIFPGSMPEQAARCDNNRTTLDTAPRGRDRGRHHGGLAPAEPPGQRIAAYRELLVGTTRSYIDDLLRIQ